MHDVKAVDFTCQKYIYLIWFKINIKWKLQCKKLHLLQAVFGE